MYIMPIMYLSLFSPCYLRHDKSVFRNAESSEKQMHNVIYFD